LWSLYTGDWLLTMFLIPLLQVYQTIEYDGNFFYVKIVLIFFVLTYGDTIENVE